MASKSASKMLHVPSQPVTAANVFEKGRPMREQLDYFRERIADLEYEQRHGLPSVATPEELSPAFRLELYRRVYDDLNVQSDRRF